MEFLKSVLKSEPAFLRLKAQLEAGKKGIAATGLSRIHTALITAALGQKCVVIAPDEPSANELYEDLINLGVDALYFPSRDLCFSDAGVSKEYEIKRINTLSRLLDGAFGVLVCPVSAAASRTVPRAVLKDSILTLKCGEEVDIISLCKSFESLGYRRSETVDGVGMYSVRGGIIDIFSSLNEAPNRIELWGDEIDTISAFDLATQRRSEGLTEIKIGPACEVFCDGAVLAAELEDFRDGAKRLADLARENLNRDIDRLKSGLSLCLDRFLPFVFGKMETVLNYAENAVFIMSESSSCESHLDSFRLLQNEDIKKAVEQGFLYHKEPKFSLSSSELFAALCPLIIADSFSRGKYPIEIDGLINFDYKRSSPWRGDTEVLLEDLDFTLKNGGSAVVAAGEEKAARVLLRDLNDRGIPAVLGLNCEKITAGVTVVTGGLSSGFELPSAKFSFITHRHINGERRRARRHRAGKEIGSIEELKIGDYVVHAVHGIGIFGGINKITAQGITKDYVKITYAKGDVLYVPVTQLDLVSKYIGAADDGGIKIHKLGGVEWQKTRSRVRTAVRDMAKQLTALYAKRMSTKGHAFSPDTDLQSDFERRFPYDETPDQLRSIDEIKGDMERAVPMDRLLCGDVGFGKTEVALRAAFKCVCEGKQCAFLVPTTILAWQHYNTVLSRFGELPLETKMLSRFVSKREQEKVIRGLKNGTVDMVIGTHRMISSDVVFRDLGLVIVDEEQRFGVAQKEKLKEKYPAVDVLTLSATPIPRTLNMAMSGLRDMSSIDEAPSDRHPVQTYVLEHNKGVLLDAINKELRRGGQVYYLHNRVESIEKCAASLKADLPEDTRIAVAHGKMSEDELSRVWKSLMEQEIDVLVCTTIIETGVDVANANTLIIEDADRMGLAQLHQLRGRVGRSPRRAYAYFCFRGGKAMSETALKRLEAIREFTEFGSGIKIAMRDLEIRGAGSILGGEQHGNMEAVGYDMYLKLLADAVKQENGEEVKEEAPCTVDLSISAHIPPDYIQSLPARLGIYRRIAEIKNDEDVSDIIDELIDRFGDPPREVEGLVSVARLRQTAAANGIYEIKEDAGGVRLSVNSIEPETMLKLTSAFGKNIFVKGSAEKPYYYLKISGGILKAVEEIRKALAAQ